MMVNCVEVLDVYFARPIVRIVGYDTEHLSMLNVSFGNRRWMVDGNANRLCDFNPDGVSPKVRDQYTKKSVTLWTPVTVEH